MVTRYYEHAKYMTDINFQILMGGTVIRKDVWESIPADLRPQLLEAARVAGAKLQKAIRDEYPADIEAMKKAGLTVVPVDARARDTWRRFIETAYPIMRGGAMPTEAFDDALRFRDELRRQRGAGSK
jgi:TRAP-type C4-dicarboxylate transport system substrate-binding protein